MKKITLFLLLLMAAPQGSAQSLSDLFRSLFGSGRTEEAESKPEAPKFPAASTLVGTWIYNDLIVDYTGSDMLAQMAVSALRGQAADLAVKMGLQSGRDKVQLTNKGRATLEIGGNRLEASYKYAPASGTIELTLRAGDRTATFRGTAQTADGELHLTFDATDCMRVIRTVAPEAMENTYFKTLNAIVEQYPGLRGGCSFTRG